MTSSSKSCRAPLTRAEKQQIVALLNAGATVAAAAQAVCVSEQVVRNVRRALLGEAARVAVPMLAPVADTQADHWRRMKYAARKGWGGGGWA